MPRLVLGEGKTAAIIRKGGQNIARTGDVEEDGTIRALCAVRRRMKDQRKWIAVRRQAKSQERIRRG